MKNRPASCGWARAASCWNWLFTPTSKEPPLLTIVRMYDALNIGDVYAVIAYYLTHPAEIDEYLGKCDLEADAVRRKIEASQRSGPTREELLARAKAKGLNL